MLEHLEAELVRHRDRRLLVGSFSAASNVTGIRTDTRAIATLLHRFGALSFGDFAAAGPYVAIEMNLHGDVPDGHLAYKDAVFLSPHKFIGGPGTPGVLVAKRRLFTNEVPAVPGGGTVAYVNPTEHRYIRDIEHREEGGTPAILESIRAGLVFQLKDAVGTDEIARREESFIRRAIASWRANPNLLILGNPDASHFRSCRSSFAIARSTFTILVVALLNDLPASRRAAVVRARGPRTSSARHRPSAVARIRARDLEGL